MPLLEKELDLFPCDLLERAAEYPRDGSLTDSAAGSTWWAIYTRSRQEKSLMRYLKEREIAYYGPTIERRYRSPAGRIRTSYTPLFPNYVFIFGEAEQRTEALKSNCVSRTISVANAHQLTQDLAKLHRLVLTGEPLTPEARLLPGDVVRVKSGPFAGFEGTVVRRNTETRLLIAVEFMQQGASVLLEDCQLELLSVTRSGRSQ